MKRLVILFLIIPLLSMTIENDKAKFVGEWIGDDGKEFGYLNFDSEGYAYFKFRGQIFGGKEFVFDGQKGKMTYEINDQTNPIQVDLTITKLETGEQKKLLCIAEFIDNDTMKFALTYEKIRPTDFDSKNAFVIKRVK